MKKEKKKKHAENTLPSPPKETRRYWGQTPLGTVTSRIWSGKFSNKSTVAFSLSLPEMDLENFHETRDFLEQLRDCFLLFLSQKSQIEKDGVTFGGLSFHWEKDGLFLSFCYGPFSEREFFPFARLTLSPTGALVKIDSGKQKAPRAKRPRGNRSTILSRPSW